MISTAPDGTHCAESAPGASGARRRRRAKTPEARTANWSSVAPEPVSAAAKRPADRSSRLSGRSTTPPQRPWSSSPATRPSPHTCACTALRSTSDRPTETAPVVTHHSGASSSASAAAWSSATVAPTPRGTSGSSKCGPSASARNDSTPVTAPSAARASSRCWDSAQRSASSSATSITATSAPSARSARRLRSTSSLSAWLCGRTASHVPLCATAEASSTGFQATR